MEHPNNGQTTVASEGWKHHTRAKCIALAVGYYYIDRADPNSWYWLFKYESGL